MELVVNQQIYYSNKKLIPIEDVADSLLALERVIRHSPEVLEALFPGVKIGAVDIYIKALKSDSLWEDVVVKFMFGSQDKLDLFIENARERLGMNKISNDGLLSVIIILLIFVGYSYLLNRDQTVTQQQRDTIEANNNTIINIGAGMVDMTAEEFRILIDGAVKDKEKLAKDAVRIVKPAKLDPEASITFNDNQALQILPETVRAMPGYVSDLEDEEFIEDFPSLEMEVRATDLDSTKRGWAVVMPEISEERVKLHLDSTIDRRKLHEKDRFKGSATVIFKLDKKYKKLPKLVLLREIIE